MDISTKPELQNLTKSSFKPTAIIVYQGLSNSSYLVCYWKGSAHIQVGIESNRSTSCLSFQTTSGSFCQLTYDHCGKTGLTPLQHNVGILSVNIEVRREPVCQTNALRHPALPIFRCEWKCAWKVPPKLDIDYRIGSTGSQLESNSRVHFPGWTAQRWEWLGTLINASYPYFIWWISNFYQIKSAQVYSQPQHLHILQGWRGRERGGNAVKALLLHSEGRVFQRRLVCN